MSRQPVVSQFEFWLSNSAWSISRTISAIVIETLVRPAAIAGVAFSDLCVRTKLYQTKYSANAWQWLAIFLLKAFVSRVKRHIDMRMVKL